MRYEVALIWEDQSKVHESYTRTKIDEIDVIECYVSTNGITGNKSILLDFRNSLRITDIRPQRFRGVEIQILPFSDKFELAIILMDSSLESIFVLLAEDLLKEVAKVSNQEEAFVSAFHTIGLWKKMFENFTHRGLTSEQQRGLFGELFFMKKSILNGVGKNDILLSWTGPDAANQDYFLRKIKVEVKTSIANHPLLQISNEMQLTSDSLSKLFIYFITLTEQRGEALTLNSLIDDLRNSFSTDYRLTDIFNAKLISSGFQDEYAEQYALREYIVRDTTVYEVTNGFPRITSADLLNGVHHVVYKIEPAACTNFTVTSDIFFEEFAKS